jgi:hypothetical protein
VATRKPFRSDKRKKEVARLKKQEEKRQRRFGAKAGEGEEETEEMGAQEESEETSAQEEVVETQAVTETAKKPD